MTTNRSDVEKVRCASIAHVIYYVSSMQDSLSFYTDLLGLSVVDSLGEGGMFLRSDGSPRHFDLGLVEVGVEARVPEHLPTRMGVYHVGWQVGTFDDLFALYTDLERRDLLIGTSDHGTHISLYAVDPDNNEVEVCWERPARERATEGLVVSPLDIEAEMEKHRLAKAEIKKERTDEDPQT